MRLPRNFNQSYHRSQNCNHSAPQPFLTLGGVSPSDILNSDFKVLTVLSSCSCLWNVLGPHYTLCPAVCMLLEVLTIHESWSFFCVNHAENIEPQHHNTRSACAAICTWQWSLSWLDNETIWAPLKCIWQCTFQKLSHGSSCPFQCTDPLC